MPGSPPSTRSPSLPSFPGPCSPPFSCVRRALSPDKARRRLLQSSVEESLGAIVSQVNARRDHLPPVVSGSTVTFPFDISVSGEGNPSFGLEAVKRMLLSSNPPSVLH